jgi:hypothetical protein
MNNKRYLTMYLKEEDINDFFHLSTIQFICLLKLEKPRNDCNFLLFYKNIKESL